MTDLLIKALDAHGGLDRWRSLGSVSADLAIGGAIWDVKRQSGLFANCSFAADIRRQRAVMGHVGGAGRWVRWTPDHMSLVDRTGAPLEERDHPRDAFKGHVNETPWDTLHAAYFCTYALWTYVTIPFLYTFPGFAVQELGSWQENGETWQMLGVRFPDNIVSHTRSQVSFFGPDGLLRRHDYAVDVLGGSAGAHYVEDYRDCQGIQTPFRRRIYPLGPDTHKVPEPVLVSIDVKSFNYASAEFPWKTSAPD